MPPKKTKEQKPLTLEDLAAFTEQVIFPGVAELIKEGVNEGLKPIKTDIEFIKTDIRTIKNELTDQQKDIDGRLPIYRFERFKKYNKLKEELIG